MSSPKRRWWIPGGTLLVMAVACLGLVWKSGPAGLKEGGTTGFLMIGMLLFLLGGVLLVDHFVHRDNPRD